MESLKTAPDVAELAAQPLAALQVLRVVEDGRASSADLARVIEADPGLSARVMRLANSPYYGLSRRVGSASRAVVLLGFSAVRALAVSAAYGLLVDETNDGLPGFWSHCVCAAVGASCVARIAGAPMNDAFSAGLLHDVGLGLGASSTWSPRGSRTSSGPRPWPGSGARWRRASSSPAPSRPTS